MPVTPTYPGVYVEEIPSGVRTITGVATSITAFIGLASKGPANDPVRIQSFADYERQFGGLASDSMMSYAVQQFFLNGGSDALIVRLSNGGAAAKLRLPSGNGSLVLTASSEGFWGNNLQAIVDYATANRDQLFNLTVQYVEGDQVTRETIRNLSVDPTATRYIVDVLKAESSFVRVEGNVPTARPNETSTENPSAKVQDADKGSNGTVPADDSFYVGSESARTGIYALEKADLFNLLCIPPVSRTIEIRTNTLAAALTYCVKRRALLIVDPPLSWHDTASAETGIDSLRSSLGAKNANYAAVYFPRLKLADPLKENRTQEFAPCGAIAGLIAATDATRGVWKAPAGIDASLTGVRELTYKLTDPENGRLNPKGLNCIRSFPTYGNVIWGARTLAGDDRLASEWKYVPVRRLALFLEESLFRGTQWVVFEPNDEPLWAQIRLNLGAFMNNLFRQGAFQGKTPKEAYFVKCDSETTTQTDINLGIVNIVIGFAPLKPAEFVILKFQQMAGQIVA